MTIKLSRHFTLEEMEFSATAIRLGIDNRALRREREALRELCVNVLQPIRDFWGPVKVSSGFRSGKLNRAIGGDEESQHRLGEAADFEVPGSSNLEVARWVIDSTDFDQCILEYFTGALNSGWIHVSYSSRHRREILHKQKGSPYLTGLGR